MKKALHITLAGSLFTIEEDAFEHLKQYLTSIKDYFNKIADSQDVIDDIEARVAEQLLEKIKNHNNIVTKEDVEMVIKSMGSIDEISDSTKQNTDEQSGQETISSRKLYRSDDDVVIAGVASGMAAYFGIDPLIMRILFIILTMITSGGFIFIYIILVFLVPKAITASEKINMKGGPTTLHSFKETLNEQVHNIKNNSKDIISKNSPFRTGLEKLFHFLGSMIRLAIKIILKVIGLAFTIIPLFISVVAVFIASNLIFNTHLLNLNFPIETVIPYSVYYLFIIVGFLIVFIPALLITFLGLSILSHRQILNTVISTILGGVWIFTLLAAGTLGLHYIPDIHSKILALPEYQESSQTTHLAPFKKLILQGSSHITLVEGEKHTISIKGRKMNTDALNFKVEDNTLFIDEKNNEVTCPLFCVKNESVQITISAPEIESLYLDDTVNVRSKNITTDNFTVDIKGAASADLTFDTKNLNVYMDGSSQLTAHGTTTNLIVSQLDIAWFYGNDLEAQNTTSTTKDASVFIGSQE